MKKRYLIFTILFIGIQVVVPVQTTVVPIYQSDAFSVFRNKIIQGKYTATALSPTEIQSDYQSEASAFKSSRINFKFSINGLDNEMLPGINHEFVCLTGDCETLVIPFGTQTIDKQPVPPNTYLKPNTLLKIRLDMRPVFAQFEKFGYYTNFNWINNLSMIFLLPSHQFFS